MSLVLHNSAGDQNDYYYYWLNQINPLWFEFPQNWMYSKHLFFYLNFLLKQTRFPFEYNVLMTYQWRCLYRFQSPTTMIFNIFLTCFEDRLPFWMQVVLEMSRPMQLIDNLYYKQWYTINVGRMVQHTAACKFVIFFKKVLITSFPRS